MLAPGGYSIVGWIFRLQFLALVNILIRLSGPPRLSCFPNFQRSGLLARRWWGNDPARLARWAARVRTWGPVETVPVIVFASIGVLSPLQLRVPTPQPMSWLRYPGALLIVTRSSARR